jgi:Arc/MetJ family transcription regulator
MPKTVINIDLKALLEAARFFGTKTAKATVNTALREAVAHASRTEELLDQLCADAATAGCRHGGHGGRGATDQDRVAAAKAARITSASAGVPAASP